MDRSFTELFELLQEMPPEGITLHNVIFKGKKILCPMGLDCVKIHACRNDCILYKKEFENLKDFPRCGKSHYKLKDNGVEDDNGVTRNGVPAKVIWYLSIIERFKILFANVNTKNTRWNANERIRYRKI